MDRNGTLDGQCPLAHCESSDVMGVEMGLVPGQGPAIADLFHEACG